MSTVTLPTSEPDSATLLADMAELSISRRLTFEGGQFSEYEYSGRHEDLVELIRGHWGDDALIRDDHHGPAKRLGARRSNHGPPQHPRRHRARRVGHGPAGARCRGSRHQAQQGGRMNEVTFHNVTITIAAATPKEAYTRLCNALAGGDSIEWVTDTYTVAGKTRIGRSTLELMPTPEEADREAEEEPSDRCTNPGGHVWNRSAGEADEARIARDYDNDNIRCIYCDADGDA